MKRINMKLHSFGGLLAVVTLAPCMAGFSTGVEATGARTMHGVSNHRVAGPGAHTISRPQKRDESRKCETIDFSSFAHGTRSAPNGSLTLTVLGVNVDVSIAKWTNSSHDCGTGQVLIFDTGSPMNGIDDDLRLAGQSVTPNLGNVVAHQTCKHDGNGEAFVPADADVETFMRFDFPAGDWIVKSFTALDQEGNAGTPDEFIVLSIDVFTDNTPVGMTSIDVNNGSQAEVVDIVPDAAFDSNLSFHSTGSGAVDDIEVCTARGGEGCTPGYWKQKHHFGSWPVSIRTTFADAFSFCVTGSVPLSRPERGDLCDLSLLEALKLRGGKQNALARHAAAAWLNAGSTVNYFYSQTEVETLVNDALASGDYEATKDLLATANEKGCPLGRSERDG